MFLVMSFTADATASLSWDMFPPLLICGRVYEELASLFLQSLVEFLSGAMAGRSLCQEVFNCDFSLFDRQRAI